MREKCSDVLDRVKNGIIFFKEGATLEDMMSHAVKSANLRNNSVYFFIETKKSGIKVVCVDSLLKLDIKNTKNGVEYLVDKVLNLIRLGVSPDYKTGSMYHQIDVLKRFSSQSYY